MRKFFKEKNTYPVNAQIWNKKVKDLISNHKDIQQFIKVIKGGSTPAFYQAMTPEDKAKFLSSGILGMNILTLTMHENPEATPYVLDLLTEIPDHIDVSSIYTQTFTYIDLEYIKKNALIWAIKEETTQDFALRLISNINKLDPAFIKDIFTQRENFFDISNVLAIAINNLEGERHEQIVKALFDSVLALDSTNIEEIISASVPFRYYISLDLNSDRNNATQNILLQALQYAPKLVPSIVSHIQTANMGLLLSAQVLNEQPTHIFSESLNISSNHMSLITDKIRELYLTDKTRIRQEIEEAIKNIKPDFELEIDLNPKLSNIHISNQIQHKHEKLEMRQSRPPGKENIIDEEHVRSHGSPKASI